MSSLVRPGARDVPAMIAFEGLEMPDGHGIASLRDRLIAVAMHAILSRESSTLAPSGHLGRLVVGLADAVLAARAAPSPAPASPVPAPPAAQGD